MQEKSTPWHHQGAAKFNQPLSVTATSQPTPQPKCCASQAPYNNPPRQPLGLTATIQQPPRQNAGPHSHHTTTLQANCCASQPPHYNPPRQLYSLTLYIGLHDCKGLLLGMCMLVFVSACIQDSTCVMCKMYSQKASLDGATGEAGFQNPLLAPTVKAQQPVTPPPLVPLTAPPPLRLSLLRITLADASIVLLHAWTLHD